MPSPQRPIDRILRDGITLLGLLGVAWLLAQWSYRARHEVSFKMDAQPAMLPRDGLYELETFSDRAGIYRWTNGSALVKLPNPGGPVAVRLVLAGGPGRSVVAQVNSGAQTFAFQVRPEPRTYSIALPASDSERITVAIDTPTIGVSRRDLGVVVGDLAIGGGGAAPSRVLLVLALATIGIYALLRQARWRLAWAAAAVLALQVLALLWQSYGGWRYGLFGPILLLAGGASLAAVALERWRPWASALGVAQFEYTASFDNQGTKTRRLGALVPWWLRTPAKFGPQRTSDRTNPLTRSDVYVVAALIALALCVRLPWLVAPDPVGDLELSARRMGFLRAEGLSGAYHDEGDYMPLRLYWLYGFSLLPFLDDASLRTPLPPATLLLIKLPGLLADLGTIGLLYGWSRRWRAPRSAAVLTALYALSPPIWMNVAWWGQVDAVLVLPLLLMVALLDRAGGRWSWVCWAGALLVKPQAIVFAPLLYLATLRRYGCQALATGGAIAAGLLALGCAPLVLAGQGPGLLQAYAGSVGRFPQLTNRAYNLWYLVTLGASGSDVGPGLGPLSYRLIGVILMGCAALLVCAALLYRSDVSTRALGAAVLALAFFTLPTQIHERYLFLPLAFLVMRAAPERPVIIAYIILMVSATINILGTLRGFSAPAHDAIVTSPVPLVLAAINILVLVALIGHLLATSVGVPRIGAALPSGRRSEVS